MNDEHGHGTNAILVETVIDPDERNIVFARAEATEKSAAALAITDGDEARWVGKVALGYVRQVSIGAGSGREVLFGVGIGVSVNAVPGTFESAYGGRWPVGFSAFLSTRPGRMAMR